MLFNVMNIINARCLLHDNQKCPILFNGKTWKQVCYMYRKWLMFERIWEYSRCDTPNITCLLDNIPNNKHLGSIPGEIIYLYIFPMLFGFEYI